MLSVRHLIWCAIIAFIMAVVIVVASVKVSSWFLSHLILSLVASVAGAIVCSLIYPDRPFIISNVVSGVVFLMCFFGAPIMGNPPPKENGDNDMEDTALKDK